VPRLSLSPPEFSILTTLVEERVGLAYALADKPIFESKLAMRLEETGHESPLDYYYHLRYDDADGTEFRALTQVLTVHETFFFRELTPLRVLIEHLLKPKLEAGQRVRVWCAACSTGEEPLTFAMLAASMGYLDRIEIIASDLSPAAIKRARAGKFGPRTVRSKIPPWATPYLQACNDGYSVTAAIASAIDWHEVNLLDPNQVARLGEFDAVLCRNVLIYFREETAQRVVAGLAARLHPGSALLVGVSESLMRLNTELQCEEHAGAFVYRKAPPA
jgi:chemotaxis protein methyltransferase CheR